MGHILHIDTSGATGRVAVATDGIIASLAENKNERDHAASINLMIDAALAQAGIQIADLKAIAICGGPGSYTGLRIGLSTAKGICYVRDIPLIMHNKLELGIRDLMQEHPGAEQYLFLLPARAGEYYYTAYNSLSGTWQEPQHQDVNGLSSFLEGSPDTLASGIFDDKALLLAGKRHVKLLPYDDIHLKAWAERGLADYKSSQFADLAHAAPFYMKAPFIHQKSK